MIKLCVFDFDSTLMDGETIGFFAAKMGTQRQVSEITKCAMAGELDFFESLSERVALIKGMKLSDAKAIAESLPFVCGASEIIAYLKNKGIKVIVFSGGFHLATDAAQKKLGFDASFANYLHEKNGILTGLFGYSKGVLLAQLKSLMGLETSEVMCVGDGANDVSRFREAGLKIAFCANEILKEHASVCIEKKDLKEIMKYV